jgi:glycine betaine/proline transport system ATP-binding protein
LPLRIRGTPDDEIAKSVSEVIALVGLAQKAQYRPHELSGGQQQRVGLARALVGDPGLLFLDEPFSALDPVIRRELQDELLRLQDRLHKTMIFVTHDFNEAVRVGDRVAIMKDGMVVQVGSPEEIVLYPADDYVRSFVADVDRSKVISCGRIAAPASIGSYARTIGARAKLASAIGELRTESGKIGVIDNANRIIGEIDAASIMGALAPMAALGGSA